jgi:hypothetical protein
MPESAKTPELANQTGVSGETKAPSTWQCPSCGGQSDQLFCPQCGERHWKAHDLSLRHLLEESAEHLFHFDSRLLRSVRSLVAKPGVITRDYLAGRRRPYVSPINIFFIANLLYLLMQTVSGLKLFAIPLSYHMDSSLYSGLATRLVQHHLSSAGLTLVQYTGIFEHAQALNSKSLVLLMVPPFALVAALLAWDLRSGAVAHLVFALHVYSFLMLFLTVLFPLLAIVLRGLKAVHGPTLGQLDSLITLFEGLVVLTYLSKAVGIVYQVGLVRRWIMAACLTASILYILYCYRFVLLVLTVLTT